MSYSSEMRSNLRSQKYQANQPQSTLSLDEYYHNFNEESEDIQQKIESLNEEYEKLLYRMALLEGQNRNLQDENDKLKNINRSFFGNIRNLNGLYNSISSRVDGEIGGLRRAVFFLGGFVFTIYIGFIIIMILRNKQQEYLTFQNF